ncbi:MAG: preprotein translocase subunit SecA [Oscillospiraceae bacterium]|nr:preprotein translocase subunit SecA [Oscillospiraceae bacterium]
MKNFIYPIKTIREMSERPLTELLEAAKDLNANEKFEKQTDSIGAAFSACCQACEKGIGLTPYDEQIAAAWTLFNGKVVEMKTGEGKTIAAVFAAFLHTLNERNVHILTYNDYLVERDYNWMKPIYDLLGISVGFIAEATPKEERKAVYQKQVVYNTAKECGFDFLRDFVADKPEDVLLKEFCAAIVDEADSILIDEARIPLVIAGSLPVKHDDESVDITDTFSFVKTLTEKDYGLSDEADSAYLTDKGIGKVEEFFDVDLYEEENSALLSVVNDCLRANFVLKENVNYIIKDNEILIIDEFTGRTAKNRRYPGHLQNAVEAKHGIKTELRGVVMGTIPLQYFIRQYKYLSGMTGTVFPSDEEFELLYGLKPDEIPPHMPSKRIDRPTEIYYNNETKLEAIKNDIIRAHKNRQPVLIGAESIAESEKLSGLLKESGVDAIVLNAKNDHAEAEIIKNAGAAGTVTISANMAGRGGDILLGGADQKSREEAVKSGGLYVISTSMRESSRINLQLRGRTGRQGDVGESKVFTALDDEIMLKYDLKKLISKNKYPSFTEEQITEKAVVKEAERIQRISEGSRLDERKRLLKYAMISEKHRDAIFKARKKFVTGETEPTFWQDNCPDDYEKAVEKFNEQSVNDLQRDLILQVINEAWSDYLIFMSSLREGIHLTSVGGKSPVDEFNVTSQKYYENMEAQVVEEMLDGLERLLELDNIEEFTIVKPESVYTYLQNESGDELVKKPIMLQAVEGARLLGEEDDEEIEAEENKKGFWGKKKDK